MAATEPSESAPDPPPAPPPTPPAKPARRLTLNTVSVIAISAGALFLITLAAYARWPRTVSPWSMGIPALTLAVLLLRRIKVATASIVVIAFALLMYANYLVYTSFGQRNFDGGEQLKYVQYIAQHWKLPSADTCFVCHHPPAYYLTAAGFYRFFELTKLAVPQKGAQYLSLLYTFGFVVFGALTLQRFTDRKWIQAFGTALIAFWPYTIMNSARMHNDVLVTAAMGASLYYLVCWYQDEKARDAWLAAGFAILSLLSKTNGYIMVAAMVAVLGYQLLFRSGRLSLLKKGAPPVLAIALAAGSFTLFRNAGSEVETTERVLGTASKIGTHEWVDNEPLNYLYFDVESFLTEPYVFARKDEGGRQYYWNHLLKSSLFATHNDVPDAETAYRWNIRIAEVMNALLLTMVLFLLGTLVTRRRDGHLKRYAVLWLSVACLIGFHMAFKAMIPAAHHNDFRMVHPLLVPFAVAYALAVQSLEASRLLVGRLGAGMGGALVLLSAVYFAPKFDLVRNYLPAKVVRIPEQDLRTERPERTKWEDDGNVIIRIDEIVEVQMRPTRDVRSLNVSFDHNDSYEIELFGATETRKVIVGPRPVPPPAKGPDGKDLPPPEFKGLAKYNVDVDPPVNNVRVIRVRPHQGDAAYSMGHLIAE